MRGKSRKPAEPIDVKLAEPVRIEVGEGRRSMMGVGNWRLLSPHEVASVKQVCWWCRQPIEDRDHALLTLNGYLCASDGARFLAELEASTKASRAEQT